MSIGILARRLVRAPFFIISLILSTYAIFAVMACITVGVWLETAIIRFGIGVGRGWIAFAGGVVLWVGIGIIGSAMVGATLMGWVGIIVGPLLAIVIIAVLGKW